MTAEATAPTEANAEAVGPVTRVDIAAPTEPNPEAPIPCETVDAVAPSEADAEQEVLFVTAEAAAPTGPDAGFGDREGRPARRRDPGAWADVLVGWHATPTTVRRLRRLELRTGKYLRASCTLWSLSRSRCIGWRLVRTA